MEEGLGRIQASPPPARANPDDVFLIRAASTLLRWRRAVLFTGLAGALTLAAVGLVRSRTYTAAAAFIPQTRRGSSAAASLAAQFGIGVAGDDASQSPAFYADLARSRAMLRSLADQRFPTATDSTSRPLVEVLRVRGRGPAERREAAASALERMLDVSVVQRTGVVRVTARSHSAVLSQALVQRMLDLLNGFNLENRQSQAAAERRFAEQRVREMTAELRASEDRLQTFLQRNRDYRNSPTLMFEENRLSRDVALKQQLVTSLAESFEQARLEEIRDTPVITVVERAEQPVFPDPRGLARRAVFGFALGIAVALLWALVAEAGRDRPPADDPRGEFEALLAAVRSEITAPLGRFQRRGRGGPGA